MTVPYPGSLSFDGILRFRGSGAVYISPDVICEWWLSPTRHTAKLKIKEYDGMMKISHNFMVIEQHPRTRVHKQQVYLPGEYLVIIGSTNSIVNINKI